MKIKSIRTILCLIFISISTIAQNDEPSFRVSDQELQTFEAECLSTQAIEDESCVERYRSLTSYLEENQHLAEDGNQNVCLAKNGEIVPVKIGDLADELGDVSTSLSCSKEDENYVKDHCGKQMACNMGRSIVTIVDNVAPDFITNKVQRSLASVLSAEEGSSCMDKELPNCLSEVYRAFISSLVATFNSLRDIGKAIKGAFSNMRAYLFEKSEDLHAAADSTQEETTKFFESPGKYIMEKLTSFKSGVDTWIKEQVFCQKWEGEPHSQESTCVEPLQSYSCLDCDDGINAFCAGAGFIISEGLLTVATAGTFTGLGLAARVGGTMAKAATVRGASSLTARVPALAKLTNRGARTSVRNSSRARKALAAAANRYARAKESVARFGNLLASSRLGRGVERVAEVSMKPLRVVDNLSNSAMERVLASATRVKGNGSFTRLLRKTAREDFRLLRMANRGEDVVTSGAGRASRTLSGARFTRLSNRRRASGGSNRSQRDRREGSSSDIDSDRTRRSSQDERDISGREDRNRRSESPEERRSREERERSAQDERRKSDEDDDNDNGGVGVASGLLTASDPNFANGVRRATRVAVAADLAVKGLRAVDETASGAISDGALDAILEGNQESGDSSAPFKDQINERTGSQFQNEAQVRKFAENMRDIYGNPSNRQAIIDRLAEDRKLSRSQASRVYESEKDFYNRMTGGRSSVGSKRSRYSEERQEINNLISRISEIKNTIKVQEGDAEGDLVETLPQTEVISDSQGMPRELNPDEQLNSSIPARGTAVSRSVGKGALASSLTQPANVNESSELLENTANGEEEGNTGEETLDGEGRSPASVVAKTDEDEEENELASRKRLKVMEFLSLLLLEVDSGNIKFRVLNPKERAFIETVNKDSGASFSLNRTKVTTLGNPASPYYLFKDFKNNKTVVMDSSGTVLEGVPGDII